MIPAEKFDLKNLEKNCLERFDQKGYLTFRASASTDSEYSSAVWGREFSMSFRAEMSYATFKVNFRNAWYKNNKENWHDYIAHCLTSSLFFLFVSICFLLYIKKVKKTHKQTV